MLSILASSALLCSHGILQFRPTLWRCQALVLSVASLRCRSCLIRPMFPLLFRVFRVLVFLRGPMVVYSPAFWSYSLVWKLFSVLSWFGSHFFSSMHLSDILIVTGLVPSCWLRVSAFYCSQRGPWPRFCCMQGPRCPIGVLSPSLSALFRASSHPTWWWTLLAFVVKDALCTWWILRYPQDFIFSALPCLVSGLIAWGFCICAWVLGLPVAEGLDLRPCWFCCSQLTPLLSVFRYGLWISLQTYHSAGHLMAYLLLWLSSPNGSSWFAWLWGRGISLHWP